VAWPLERHFASPANAERHKPSRAHSIDLQRDPYADRAARRQHRFGRRPNPHARRGAAFARPHEPHSHVSADDNTLIAEAGVVLANAQKAADDRGTLFPLSLAAEGSCTIGGNVSTNAGGVNVLRYGMTRDLVLGLEVVLADGACSI
jgi:FAD/FMN-containing dehydrogenase